jgi:hypothetical protein
MSNLNGGKAMSPSTLIQLATTSVPPINPSFYDTINETIVTDVPQPANQYGLLQNGGDKYYKKYLKYKAKYLKLKSNYIV